VLLDESADLTCGGECLGLVAIDDEEHAPGHWRGV
jgi:hypothetical protein